MTAGKQAVAYHLKEQGLWVKKSEQKRLTIFLRQYFV